MNGYSCTKAWYDFCYENPRKIKPVHHAVMHWIFSKANESSWDKEFQLQTVEACTILGITDRDTFTKALKDLVSFGAVTVVQESLGRHVARWITLENCKMYLPKKPGGKREVPPEVRGEVPPEVVQPIYKPIETNKTNEEEVGDGSEAPFVLASVGENRNSLITPLSKPEEIRDGWQWLGRVMKTQGIALETIYTVYKISPGTCEKYIDDFVNVQVSQLREPHKDTPAAMSHFVNWLKKASQHPPGSQSKSTPAKVLHLNDQILSKHYDPTM